MKTGSPFLRRSVLIKSRNAKQVVLEYLNQEIVLEGRSSAIFSRVAEYLNGTFTLRQIADEAGESIEAIQTFLKSLERTGIIEMKPLDPTEIIDEGMSGLEFYDAHRKYCNFWLEPVYSHPLWEKMTSGRATRAQVLGFAFEKYHYIEGAHEHMAIAAAHASPEMMPHLARHFIEEYNHGDIYRKGLKSLFSNEVILHSQPLPSTRALINFLSESAQAHSFAYYAGNEVLQMTENTGEASDASSIDDFYLALRKHYPFTNKLIDSFIAHTNADQKLGHESVFKEMCESIPRLSQKEVSLAMGVARSMAEHLHLFMDGIDVWYGSHAMVPRLAGELLAE